MPKGEEHTQYRHGVYAQHYSPEDLAEFEDFQAHYELSQVSEEEVFGVFRLLKAIGAPGPIPMVTLAIALEKLANLRLKHKTLAEGQVLKLELSGEAEALVEAVAEILVKYVPDSQLEAALDELESLTAEGGGVGGRGGQAGAGAGADPGPED